MSAPAWPLNTDPGRDTRLRAAVARHARRVRAEQLGREQLGDEPAPAMLPWHGVAYVPPSPRHARPGQPEPVWPALLGLAAVIVSAAVSAAAYLAVLLA